MTIDRPISWSVMLPWPPVDLWPASDGKDRRSTPVTRRRASYAALDIWKEAGHQVPIDGRKHVMVAFHPPTKAQEGRDRLDTMLVAISPSLTGIAMAMGIDDSLWDITLHRGVAMTNGGGVRITVFPELAQATVILPVLGQIS